MLNSGIISLVLPCHNEEQGIKKNLASLPPGFGEVIIVDNNSTDRTAAFAKQYGAKIVKESRLGYGFAIMAGLRAARGEIIAVMDGDASYASADCLRLAAELLKENLDFVSGCRFPLLGIGSMDYANRLGNYILTLFFNWLAGTKIIDSQSGMWIFKREMLNKINLESGGMPLSEEIKMEVIFRKYKFKEIKINYYKRLGKIKLKKWRDGFRNLFFLFKKSYQLKKRIYAAKR